MRISAFFLLVSVPSLGSSFYHAFGNFGNPKMSDEDDSEDEDIDYKDCSKGLQGNPKWIKLKRARTFSIVGRMSTSVQECEKKLCKLWVKSQDDKYAEVQKTVDDYAKEAFNFFNRKCVDVLQLVEKELNDPKKSSATQSESATAREPAHPSPSRSSTENPWKHWFYATLKIDAKPGDSGV